MRTCDKCGDPAQVTIIGRPKRHLCIPCAALHAEYRPVSAEREELVFVHPPLTVKPGRRGRVARL